MQLSEIGCIIAEKSVEERNMTMESAKQILALLPGVDCEEGAAFLARRGIAVRAGLHCAPLAHESAGTLDTGTIRVSFGADANQAQVRAFLRAASKLRARYF